MDLKIILSFLGILLFSVSFVSSQGDENEAVLEYQCFTVANDTAMFGHNDRVLESDDLDVEECKSACLAETEFVCRSFDYLADNNRCYLSSASGDTHPEAIDEHYFAAYYERSPCSVDSSDADLEYQCFEATNEAAMFGHNDRVIESEDLDVEECKSACLAETEFVCRSFDYLADNNRCYLSSANSETNPSEIDEHYFSVYYERAPCKEKEYVCFNATESSAMYGHNDREVNADDLVGEEFDVEVCKRECLAETDFICRSFDFVGDNKCFLSSADSSTNPDEIGAHHFSVYYERYMCYPGEESDDDNDVEDSDENESSGF